MTRRSFVEGGPVTASLLNTYGSHEGGAWRTYTPVVYQGAHVYGSEGMIDFSTTEVRLLNAETGGEWRVERPDGRFFKVDELGGRFE